MNNAKHTADAAIDVLPAEILSCIFEFVEGSSPCTPYLKKGNWISAITHTCQRWRQAALSNPRLWTSVASFDSIDMLKTIIERSKGLALSVSLYSPVRERHTDEFILDTFYSRFIVKSKALGSSLVLGPYAPFDRVKKLNVDIHVDRKSVV